MPWRPIVDADNKLQRCLRNLNLIQIREEFREVNGTLRLTGQVEVSSLNGDNNTLIYNALPPIWLKNSKKAFLEKFIERFNNQTTNSFYSNWYQKHLSVMNELGARELSLQTDWRFVPGLGGTSTLETSVSLHPLYGFPYLPSTAVKGIARAYALFVKNRAASEEDRVLNRNAVVDACAASVFGSQDKAGDIIFHDAIPNGILPALELDIMNNHYSDYYNGLEPPGDWMKPNPIFFLTVKPNSEFRFFVSKRGEVNESLIQHAEEWLTGGLTDLGAGGKTSAGYGYFFPHPNIPSPDNAELNNGVAANTSTGQAGSTIPPANPNTTPPGTADQQIILEPGQHIAEITELTRPLKIKLEDGTETIVGGIRDLSQFRVKMKIIVTLIRQGERIQSAHLVAN